MDRVKDMTQKEHIAVHLVEGSALHLAGTTARLL
jgi:hypothetical protein